jgi:hypothetical protein
MELFGLDNLQKPGRKVSAPNANLRAERVFGQHLQQKRPKVVRGQTHGPGKGFGARDSPDQILDV